MWKNLTRSAFAVLLAFVLTAPLMPARAAEGAAFEVEVSGSTGYAICDLNLRAGPSGAQQVIGTLAAGEAFVILGEEGGYLRIRTVDSVEGYASMDYIMVNLSDVIPSISYNATNSYDSKFRSLGLELPGITGQSLYGGKAPNRRLGYEEFMMPVLYQMAKKINLAQQAALANGDCLILYEGYRPKAVQEAVGAALDALASWNADVYRAAVANPTFSKTFFISTGVSNHQLGFAIDVSLGSYTETMPVTVGGVTIQKPVGVQEYEMPSPMHELSPRSAVFTRQYSSAGTNWRAQPLAASFLANQPAQDLQRYCTDAGLTPLCSEWWHFNDNSLRSKARGAGNGGFEITRCLSRPPAVPGQETAVAACLNQMSQDFPWQAVFKGHDALGWAAAGFQERMGFI